jgi:hypothetical protein
MVLALANPYVFRGGSQVIQVRAVLLMDQHTLATMDQCGRAVQVQEVTTAH